MTLSLRPGCLIEEVLFIPTIHNWSIPPYVEMWRSPSCEYENQMKNKRKIILLWFLSSNRMYILQISVK